MPVIGIALKEINAKRDSMISGRIGIDNRTSIKGVKLNELPALNKKGLTIDFSFIVDYKSEDDKIIASITINGDALFFSDKQEDIEKEWMKDKKLPDEVNIEVINAVIKKCLIKSLSVSEDLQLPPPIALPVATGMKKEKKEE